MPKKRKGYIAPDRRDAYRALRRDGASKAKAAKIANAGANPGGKAKRSKMARKAAKTRARRGK